MRQWPVASVQATGKAVVTLVSADDERGKVLLGTGDRGGLTHLTPDEAIKLSASLKEAAQHVDPEVGTGEDPAERALLSALSAFIAFELGD